MIILIGLSLIATGSLYAIVPSLSTAAPPTPNGTCGLCVLAPSGTSLNLTGNGGINLDGSNVIVNSSSGSAISVNGNANVTAPSVGVVGGVSTSAKGTVSNLTTGIRPIGDPLGLVPEPNVAREDSSPPAPKASSNADFSNPSSLAQAQGSSGSQFPTSITCSGGPGNAGNNCESLLADPNPSAGTSLSAGQTMTFLYTDDTPISTGALGPTAVLSSGQSLGVTITTTSGQPQNFVDSYGGSASSKYQDFLTLSVPSGVATGVYTTQVTVHDGDGGVDQWDDPVSVGTTGLSRPATPTIVTGPVSSSGGSTTSTSASFTFADSTTGVSYLCSIDGEPYAPCPSGTPMYSGLAGGIHTLFVVAEDPSGTISAPSAPYTWTVHSGPPPPPPPPPPPSPPAPSVNVGGSSNLTINPGVYQDIMVSGQGSLTMNPGTYVILHEMNTSGGGRLMAAGASLYLACPSYPTPCSPGQPGAGVNLTGNGNQTLSASPLGCPPEAIYSDPNNTSTITLNAMADETITGDIHAPSGSLVLTGNASIHLDGQVVVATATITGNASVSIGRFLPATTGMTLSLSGPSSSLDIGATASLQATLQCEAMPVGNMPVDFNVTGSNSTTGSGQSDDTGGAGFSYAGKNAGADSAKASLSFDGNTIHSNAVPVTWMQKGNNPTNVAATDVTQGSFFAESSGTTSFVAQPGDTPAFSQSFPNIDFNPPAQTVTGEPSSGPSPSTRPLTDVTTDTAGDYSGTIAAQGNGDQAGVGPLQSFDAVFTSKLEISKPGNVTFNVISDDGFLLGVGNGATRVSGTDVNAPSSNVTPFDGYPMMGASNQLGSGAPGSYPVMVNFPAAGTYPYELDYFSSSGQQLSLVFGVSSSASSSAQYNLFSGYADTTRPGGSSSFPNPWAGAPNTTFVGSGSPYDTGALRFDNTTTTPLTISSVSVDIGSNHYAPWSGSQTVPASGSLILAGTGANFDTSEAVAPGGGGGGGTLPSLPPAPGTTGPGWTVDDFATGFPNNGPNSIGPLGLAFDSTNHLEVADGFNDDLYRFNLSGGSASSADLGAPGQSAWPSGRRIAGLAFSRSGRLYAAIQEPAGYGEIDELNPLTGAKIRVVFQLSFSPCDLQIDPLTGDLFFSECSFDGGQLIRVQNEDSSSPTAIAYGPGEDVPLAVDFQMILGGDHICSV